ncbi:hypothetical protein AsAng_0028190 [Aureispira anguillae]|uniref:Uncharacterized protein n=1 Tax=Aureispira anguillae TaxID=2864201 RepID=A0A915YFD3_9BACT|nr:hypothetical protein AsAng_0028190 [Aureispira anguillae]
MISFNKGSIIYLLFIYVPYAVLLPLLVPQYKGNKQFFYAQKQGFSFVTQLLSSHNITSYPHFAKAFQSNGFIPSAIAYFLSVSIYFEYFSLEFI